MGLSNNSNINHSGITFWLIILTTMIFLIIVIGGLTRLTDSGLSMVDWRPIMGTLPPLSYESWMKVFNIYKSSPEFLIVNHSISLDEFKYIFWWEWFHRFFARCIGIVFIIPFIYFLVTKRITKNLFLTLIFVFLFGMFQAGVGWWMVKSGLVNNPYVSAYRLTFHLMNALIIFCILFWATLNSFVVKIGNNSRNNILNYFFYIAFLFLFITIISGGFMAGTDAGNSFNTFPLMNGNFIPEDYYLEYYGRLNFFENTVSINFNHRWLASFTFIFIFTMFFYLLISKKKKLDYISIFLVLFFITAQFLLGVLTLVFNVPIIFASLHQTNSILLLGSMLFSYHSYIYKISK